MSERTITFEISQFHTFLGLAGNLIEIAKNTRDGEKFKFCLGSMAFTAFALEALANWYGKAYVPDWKYLESSSPIGKIVLISRYLDIEPQFGEQPWQTMSEIFRFRNDVVHSKLTTTTKTVDWNATSEKIPFMHFGGDKFKEKLTLENAQRYRECGRIFHLLWESAAFDKKLPIQSGFHYRLGPDESANASAPNSGNESIE